jgi:endonuclease-8
VPEGDTIWRTARTLDAALAGKTLTGFDSTLPAALASAARHGLVGKTVESVEAHGKHLLVCFGGGVVLHTHQGMKGGWRLYRKGSARRPPRGRARARLETSDAVALCHRAPVVEVLSRRQRASHPALVRLGPDVLAEDFDPREARARLRRHGSVEIGVALLDQTALAGVGNVYKSEVLFLAGVAPGARVGELDDECLERVVVLARDLMSRNRGAGPRRTTSALSSSPLWVYRRTGRPCRRCGSRIRRVVQGEQARATYFCPGCQAPPPPRCPDAATRR